MPWARPVPWAYLQQAQSSHICATKANTNVAAEVGQERCWWFSSVAGRSIFAPRETGQQTLHKRPPVRLLEHTTMIARDNSDV